MLWQGNRTADDFWGPPGRDEPYFAAVTRAYGQSAEEFRKAVPRWELAVDRLDQAAVGGPAPPRKTSSSTRTTRPCGTPSP